MTQEQICIVKALIETIQRDDTGTMVAGQWMGGNGGLISQETQKWADVARKMIEAEEKEHAA